MPGILHIQAHRVLAACEVMAENAYLYFLFFREKFEKKSREYKELNSRSRSTDRAPSSLCVMGHTYFEEKLGGYISFCLSYSMLFKYQTHGSKTVMGL